jgi:hypothetical protein
MKLLEFSPPTIQGSFGRGLVFNKLWLLHELEKIQDQFSTIYILGALQSRDDVDHDLGDYDLGQTLYQGSRSAQDPETSYTSLLRIGVK